MEMMKKNKMMRTASALLVATLLTTSVISGTFAKYTSSASGSDSARVARWGFNDTASINLNDLFKTAYKNETKGETVKSKSTEDVIAPGTTNSATFKFDYSGTQPAPEVAYTFKVDATGSSCDDSIKSNTNIQWKLDNGDWGTWDQMIRAIEALGGNVSEDQAKDTPADYYEAGTLPTEFSGTTTHTVSWQWKFDENSNDATDTTMGNAATLANVKLVINITATQVD